MENKIERRIRMLKEDRGLFGLTCCEEAELIKLKERQELLAGENKYNLNGGEL